MVKRRRGDTKDSSDAFEESTFESEPYEEYEEDSFGWRPYVSSRERRRRAEAESKRKQAQLGRELQGVKPSGRALATTFWGKAWCTNLERYQDYANRLPRGRSYLRQGCVIDLRIEPGAVKALVQGTSLYEVTIAIHELPKECWSNLKEAVAGRIESLVALLAGSFPEQVMTAVTAPGTGMFPHPTEIEFRCGCPDWASMCKHVAATLYGVGTLLDRGPELLFTLRAVNSTELIQGAASQLSKGTTDLPQELSGVDLGALFGIDLTTDDMDQISSDILARSMKS